MAVEAQQAVKETTGLKYTFGVYPSSAALRSSRGNFQRMCRKCEFHREMSAFVSELEQDVVFAFAGEVACISGFTGKRMSGYKMYLFIHELISICHSETLSSSF